MKAKLSILISLFMASLSNAALPSSPLNSEYTLSGTETLTDSKYTLGSTGILNIGSDSQGEGVLELKYSSLQTTLEGDGIINIGTESTSGKLYITGVGDSYATSGRLTAFTGNSTMNINKSGEFIINGKTPNFWGVLFSLPTTTNLWGKMTITPSVSSNAYVALGNLNLYKGAYIRSGLCLQMADKAVWNINESNAISSWFLRFGTGSNQTVTFNMNAANSFGGFTELMVENSNNTVNLNINEGAQNIKRFGLNNNSTINFNFLSKKAGENFIIQELKGKDGKGNYTSSTFNFGNFANDFICFSLANGLEVQGNRLYLSDINIYIDLKAYVGEIGGEEILGDWSLVLNEADGFYYLNNSGVIPEPASIAFIIGVLALFMVCRRKRF